MKINKTTVILTAVISPLALLYFLYTTAKLPNQRPNGFNRILREIHPIQLYASRMTEPLQSIAGTDSNGIYFTVPNPMWLIKLDTTFSEQDTVYVDLEKTSKVEGNFSTFVDLPYYYVVNNNGPSVYLGVVGYYGIDSVKFKTGAFMRSVFIPPYHMILSCLNNKYTSQIIYRVDLRNGNIEDSVDLMRSFSTGDLERDGFVAYDVENKRTFFIEYYRNKIYCLDSTFSLLYKASTIDTTSTTSVGFQELDESDGVRITPSTPRIPVNLEGCVDGNRLYVRSALKSDNEKAKVFRNNAVIDVYDVNNGNYISSFYIPYQDGAPLMSFRIKDDRIICLYKGFAAYFTLPSI